MLNVKCQNTSGSSSSSMHVVNRHGEKEPVSFDQILKRLSKLSEGLHPLVDAARVTQAVVNGMYSGIKTCQLDELAAQTCAYMAPSHPDYAKLAARVANNNLHKQTSADFSEVVRNLYEYHDSQGRPASMIAKDVFDFVMEHRDRFNEEICYDRDFEYDYFGFKTLERSYLLRIGKKIAERPQHMLMRVSCGIHCGDIDRTIETYHLLSNKFFTHATPTLFNAGTPKPQMSSCFLLAMQSDSIEGIFDTLKQCALISKTAGGIGIAAHCIRATDSYIRGTNGRSNGLVPMLRVFNDTARYVDQGGGKRKGSFAIYLEPWHADVMEYLDLRKNHGKEELRCRDLFFGLWVPDLFMKRVEANSHWTLMCPNECPDLHEKWGSEFEELYEKYEKDNRGRKTIQARDLWFKICESQTETGTPYMLYKDRCNRKSNQQNLGTIKSSNLCTEIVEYTAADEVAVCNLASMALPKYVDTTTTPPTFDYKRLYEVTKVVTVNLNRVIDRNYYPVVEARYSNMRHRPIGIGVQGLADCFMLMRFPFDSLDARQLNRNIFETIYFASCEASCELAEEEGHYETFKGSPASQGRLQFDLWNEEYAMSMSDKRVPLSGMWDWDTLKARIIEKGMRNSLLVAPMPTASTSQILGNNEAFEPYTSNIYSRRVLAGEFCVVNPHLLGDLIALGLWDDTMKQRLMAHNGSVQNISGIPQDIKALYKTVWELKQKTILEMAADRGPFIDQSQSLNIHLEAPSYSKISAMHFHGWKLGLKTGVYYLRTKAAADAIKFTVDQSAIASSLSTTISSLSPAPPPLSPVTTTASDTVLSSPTGLQVFDSALSSQQPVGFVSKTHTELYAEKGAEKREVVDKYSYVSDTTIKVCPWRRKSAPAEEHCDMCSG
eukprot:GHVQ01013601.1.p1 GENE.GHVQ01013601.1~~GHVQ01013601.1.p1  ORF type:complete len:889 (+),score=111.72 GHVQ01013601.1:369-3035(+)